MSSSSARFGRAALAAWIVLAPGCTRADPDEALRRHDLDGAAAAWKARTGEDVSFDHSVADILATRAGRDPTVTTAQVVDALDAVRLLDACPRRGLPGLDVDVEPLEAVLGAAEALAVGPWLFAVGRSATPADRDAYLGGPLPFAWGRVVGWARAGAATLGKQVDDENPTHLVTLSLRDAGGAVCVTLERRDRVWSSTGASDAAAALRVLSAGESYARGGAAEVNHVYGRGLTRKVP